MNFLGNNPSLFTLNCDHSVCLNCINAAGEWSPLQPKVECEFEFSVELC